MLISPPFLLTRIADETEDEWINRCMVGGQPGDGAFPLSANLGWHGGLHLIAPMNGTEPEPVRAIANGTVVFSRMATPQPGGPLSPGHPQAYRGKWTDNGAVVIRHETEIGSGAKAKVVFFSIYMHLSAVHRALHAGRKIHRKSEIGTAGQIYGDVQRRIHFEIVCDDANLIALIGRGVEEFPIDSDGRMDAVYGSIYFLLPEGTPFYGQKPLDNHPAACIQTSKANSKSATPAMQVLQPTYTSGRNEKLVVEIRYSEGDAIQGRHGGAWSTTLHADGSPAGNALEEMDGEYNLYNRAKEISGAYPESSRPAPSAIYELLRFGRVVDIDNEVLSPIDVPHWRCVSYPGGKGWVNLNSPNVRKYSDADLPPWKLWRLVNDSADQDSRCDSILLKSWLSPGGNGKIDPIEAMSRLGDGDMASRLSRCICRFPTEWDGATIDRRWSWLRTSSVENLYPFSSADFELLRQHIAALAFFSENIGLPANHWHFQPREFIKHFRQCGWLDENEMLRCMPMIYRANSGNRSSPVVSIHIDTATARIRLNDRGRSAMMRITRKYGIKGRRMIHFLAQIFQETGVLRWAQELASGSEYEHRADLGNNQPGDGVRFKGRGLIQTTGRANYASFSRYHGRVNNRDFTVAPNNLLLATNQYYSADAAGLYWVSRNIGGGRICISRAADQGVSEASIRQVTKNVNGAEDGPWTGLTARRSHAKVIASVLLDETAPINPEKIRDDV